MSNSVLSGSKVNSAGFLLECALMLDGLKLAVDFVLGVVTGYIAHAIYDRSQASSRASLLRKKYGHLAGEYVNFRADGSATGGTIELSQNSDGSFEIVALHSNRTLIGEACSGWMKSSRIVAKHIITIVQGIITACNSFSTLPSWKSCM